MSAETILWEHKNHAIGADHQGCPGKKGGCYEHKDDSQVKNHLTFAAGAIMFMLVVAAVATYKFWPHINKALFQ